MNNIIIIGTSFCRNGSGVPGMNSVFYETVSNRINVKKLDILQESSEKFPHINKIISRNLYLLTIRKKIINENIHVMHTMDLCTIIPFVNLSKHAKKKIITVHDFYPFYINSNKTLISTSNDVLKRHCYNYLNMYDHIFATTEEISNRLINDYKINPNKISVQGPIIGYEYSPIKIDIQKEKTIIGYINNFTWNKAPMLKNFIEVFKSIQSRELEFHIYGKDFPFHNLINEDRRIKYFGFLEEDRLPDTLASFSVYLSTSIVEGFSIPIAKAKAMKIPVLSYDGELPEITKKNTLLWDKNNLKDIIINKYWDNINISKAYKDIEKLRPEFIVERTSEIYKKIFGE